MNEPTTLIALARRLAEQHHLPPELVCAVVEQESRWKPEAVRFEPGFKKKYQANYISQFPDCPYLLDSLFYSSLGLMQVMTGCAWERGFRDNPARLYDPATGLEWGCRLLAKKFHAAGWDGTATFPESVVRKALLLWNGGARPAYVNEVLERVARYVEPAAQVPDPQLWGDQ